MRSFGPEGKRQAPARRVPFKFTVLRDEEPETHTFQAIAVSDIASLTATLKASDRHPERQVIGMQRLIAKMLDNKDGVSSNWAPKLIERPAEQVKQAEERSPSAVELEELGHNRADAWTDPEDVEPDVEMERKFRGPDGVLYDFTPDNIAKFTAPEVGSSKRRWKYLMEEDDDAIVNASDLGKLFEYLVSVAADRPTPPSS